MLKRSAMSEADFQHNEMNYLVITLRSTPLRKPGDDRTFHPELSM